MRARRRLRQPPRSSVDAQWYKDALIYELHVRSFQDGDRDGIGDFPGLTRRLPYLQDLGVSALWLLPFYPSPLRDDGYDISDYMGVHPQYGTLDDFRRFMDEAHRLGLRVITELVINHTSDQHAWFQRARTSPPKSTERDFYVWSDSPDRYAGARIIFQDFEPSNWSWDPVARAYYWHRFYAHQPDLNYDNPAVFAAVLRVLDHWFGIGVDGMRLDAVPYLIEREGTHSENLRPTHDIVKRLRAHVDRRFKDRIFIAEANQWPEDAAAYFGNGDESHMIFHFPLMPRLFMALRQEDRLPVVDIMEQTPQPPPGGQWALFLRNHDELTLEMVTEEERLYMYHVYASDAHARINLGIRRRLAPLLGNHRRRIELMNALLFSLPGTPVLYYGDEIGMGDNVYLGDRNGVRTPMQWSGDRNAGFSSASSQRLFLPLIIDDEYHHQSVHVAQQLANPHSLLWWMKRLIALRRRYQAFGRGDFIVVEGPNTRVLAFLRSWSGQRILVIANFSRFVQQAELDLQAFRGMVPVELFGRTHLPPIGDGPYPITLGPHAFLWLEIVDPERPQSETSPPRLEVLDSWEELLDPQRRGDLESVLPAYVERCAAMDLGGRSVLSVRIEHAFPLGEGSARRWMCTLRVTFTFGEPEQYLLPLGCRRSGRRRSPPSNALADLVIRKTPRAAWELFDAAQDPVVAAAFQALVRHPNSSTAHVEVIPRDTGSLSARPPQPRPLQRVRAGANAVFSMGDGSVLKLFRKLEEGPNLEVEVRDHLASVGFAQAPPVLAAFRLAHDGRSGPEGGWLGILQPDVPNEGEAWSHAVAAAKAFMRRAGPREGLLRPVDIIVPLSPWDSGSDPAVRRATAEYSRTIERLARRIADLHLALGGDAEHPSFMPEPTTVLARRSAYQRMRTLTVSVLDRLRNRLGEIDPIAQDSARVIIERRSEFLAFFHQMLETPFDAPRIRCHGNLHLGQVLHAGSDFVIIDFDGEPGRPLYERRLKRSPLHDVATMVRSFHYAAHAAARSLETGDDFRCYIDGDRMAWMRAWQLHAGATFIDAYTRALAGTDLLPSSPDQARLLFLAALLERTMYELGFEMNHRPAWVSAPILDLTLLLPVERSGAKPPEQS